MSEHMDRAIVFLKKAQGSYSTLRDNAHNDGSYDTFRDNIGEHYAELLLMGPEADSATNMALMEELGLFNGLENAVNEAKTARENKAGVPDADIKVAQAYQQIEAKILTAFGRMHLKNEVVLTDAEKGALSYPTVVRKAAEGNQNDQDGNN